MHRSRAFTHAPGLGPVIAIVFAATAMGSCDRAPSSGAGTTVGVTNSAAAQTPPVQQPQPQPQSPPQPPTPSASAAASKVSRADSAPRAGAPARSGTMRSSMSGVYTEAQARRGAELYAEQCASCHVALGNHEGPVFRTSWGGVAASEMLTYLSTAMPKNDPGSLTTSQYVVLMAYLFQLNGMPAGTTALPAEEAALRQIRIDTIGNR